MSYSTCSLNPVENEALFSKVFIFIYSQFCVALCSQKSLYV
jgi:hypothetical protein